MLLNFAELLSSMKHYGDGFVIKVKFMPKSIKLGDDIYPSSEEEIFGSQGSKL